MVSYRRLMQSVMRWLRGLSGLLVAALLVAMAFGPAVDGVFCAGDGVPAGKGSATIALQAGGTAHGQLAGSDQLDGGVCQHGHCHAGVAIEPVSEIVADAMVNPGDRSPIGQFAARLSNPHYGLDRPPRA